MTILLGVGMLVVRPSRDVIDVLEVDYGKYLGNSNHADISFTLEIFARQTSMCKLLGVDREECRGIQTLVRGPKGAAEGDFYMERRRPLNDGDSGWHPGSLDRTVPPNISELTRVPVHTAFDEIPAIAIPLVLPVGYLAVFKSFELLTIVDPNGFEVWNASRAG